MIKTKECHMIKNLSIMYVEDDNLTRHSVQKILQKYYQEVFVAKDGEEGLLKYQSLRPNIVLTDLNMPKMDGLEMVAAIKQLNPNQVIALLTAHNEPSYQRQSSELGISTYILKPLNHKEFIAALNYLNQLVEET